MIRLSSQTIFTPRCFRSSFTDGEARGQIRPSTFTAETANGRIVSICRGPRLAPRLASLHLLPPSWVYVLRWIGSNPLQHLCLPFTLPLYGLSLTEEDEQPTAWGRQCFYHRYRGFICKQLSKNRSHLHDSCSTKKNRI